MKKIEINWWNPLQALTGALLLFGPRPAMTAGIDPTQQGIITTNGLATDFTQ